MHDMSKKPAVHRILLDHCGAAFGGGVMHSIFGDYELTFLLAGVFCIAASGLVINIRKHAPIASQA
ncbi:MAG TPA: hypothetical protein VE710_25210 [Candidatus Bathyarchaeia archaeon]|nr:hypothetical protein [Candidatus Bathyarchaeia archaeon]